MAAMYDEVTVRATALELAVRVAGSLPKSSIFTAAKQFETYILSGRTPEDGAKVPTLHDLAAAAYRAAAEPKLEDQI
jgi:hypothetical protein